jgi:hypothetical protein
MNVAMGLHYVLIVKTLALAVSHRRIVLVMSLPILCFRAQARGPPLTRHALSPVDLSTYFPSSMSPYLLRLECCLWPW